MIDIKKGELKDLWPDETSPEFLSISYAIKLQLADIIACAAKVGIYYDIDDLDEETLDYLAIELRAVYYDQALPIEKKRELIRNALLWHSKAGTTKALEEMMHILFGSGTVSEWYENGEAPYTFRLKLGDEVRSLPDSLERINQIIDQIKNVRSHLTALTFERNIKKNIYIGTGKATNQRYTLADSPHLHYESSEKVYAATGLASIQHITAFTNAKSQEKTSSPFFVGAGMCAIKHYTITEAGRCKMVNTAKAYTGGAVQTCKRITVSI